MLEEILAYNKKFVEDKGYEAYITNKYPDKKIAILSCMDTRLTALLPAALGIKNGDVKMIKNAGGVISHPFGSVIRSLLVAIFELGVEEIMVIAHSDCGACHMHSEEMLEKMKARGIPYLYPYRIPQSGHLYVRLPFFPEQRLFSGQLVAGTQFVT